MHQPGQAAPAVAAAGPQGLTTFVTMDDVMQSLGAPEEDPRDGFDLGGWLLPHFDEQTGQYMNGVFDQA